MNKYEECLALSKEHGLYLDDRIERKQENGLYGMYATAKIPKGTLIVSFPKSSLLPEVNDESYTNPNVVKWTHSIARELQKGKDSSYQAHTAMLETLDELKQHSLYFFPQEERQTLSQMSLFLGHAIEDYFAKVEGTIQAIKEVDPELEEDHIIQAVLNSISRAWGDYGLLPVVDLFNHSETKGVILEEVEDNTRVGLTIKQDYEVGQQVWLSYGRKDIFSHATDYNYFDSSNNHIIDYGARAGHILDNPQKIELAEFIAKHYQVSILEKSGQKHLTIKEQGLHIFEEGPSEKLFGYFLKTGFTTLAEFKQKTCSPLSACLTYSGVIEAFLAANHVDQFKLTKLPPRLRRFHQALKKEKKMLLANKKWAEREIEQLKNN
jgi:hypothetical protein